MKYFKIFLPVVAIFIFSNVSAFDFANPPVHAPSDTIKAQQIINSLEILPNLGDRIALAAELLIGGEYDDYYEKDSVADLRLNLENFTPLMFVNNSVALAKGSMSLGNPSWRNFSAEFENISCRRGEDTGFPSIMYHTSDWIIDNSSRGNLKELTENYSGVLSKTKSLDKMTRYRKNFAALADSSNFERVRMTEMGFRTHRIPALKKETIKKRDVLDDLQNGDVIILIPNGESIDIYDIGIVALREDGPHLIHVHPQTGRVEITPDNLTRYFPLMTKYFQGYRIIRIIE